MWNIHIHLCIMRVVRLSSDELKTALAGLDERTADALESERLEIKRRPRDQRELRELAVKAAVCFANQQGGTLLVGVRDRTRGRDHAIEGVPSYDLARLRREVHQATSPSILVDLEEIDVPEGRLLAVHVPRGIPPHTTTSGQAWIRVGDACEPLLGEGLARLVGAATQADRSAEVITGTDLGDIDPSALEVIRRDLELAGRTPALARASDSDLLEGLSIARDGRLTRAALVLAGRREAIARHVPQHEITLLRYVKGTSYDARRDLRGPLLVELAIVEEFLDGASTLRIVRPSGFAQLELPELTWEVAREAVLNAVSHRDYFVSQGIILSLRPKAAEVTSPGGFVGGVTADNILRHPPAHRNELLVRCLQQLGLVNRVGQGVDRIYEGLLRIGARQPTYRDDETSVTVELPLGGSDSFAAWLYEHERRRGPLSLDDLLVLRRLAEIGTVDLWATRTVLQLDDVQSEAHLVDMRSRGLIVRQGRGRTATYALARDISTRLRGRAITDADRPLEGEGVRLRVLQLLGERGQLSNAEIRELSGFSRDQVIALERGLIKDGLAHFEGRGRGARLVLGPPGETGGSLA